MKISLHNLYTVLGIKDESTEQMKKCVCCNKWKPLSEYRILKANEIKNNGYTTLEVVHRNDCKKCESGHKKVLRQINPYIPPKPDRCQCCGKVTDKLNRDHCHETHVFRGWICTACNNRLSKLGDNKENVIMHFKQIMRYLKSDSDYSNDVYKLIEDSSE